MQTVPEMFSAFSDLFLDVAPFAALIALAVSWVRRRKWCREEERELRERIDFYHSRKEPGSSGISRSGEEDEK